MKLGRVSMGVAALLFGFTGVAGAAPMSFFGQDTGIFGNSGSPIGPSPTNSMQAEADFLANLQGVGTEGFESYSDGTGAPLGISFPGAGTATLSGSGAVDNDPSTGQNAVGGDNWWRTGTGGDFRIDFDTPVAAFGFYGIDIGDIGSRLTVVFETAGGDLSVDVPHGLEFDEQNGSVLYFGYIDQDNPFTGVRFINSGSGDDFGFDNFTIGSVEQVREVPEPSTIALLGLGLGALGFAGFRRRKNA